WHSGVDFDQWVAFSVAGRRLSARYKLLLMTSCTLLVEVVVGVTYLIFKKLKVNGLEVISVAQIIGSFLTRGLIMVFGYAYPGNECFESVEKNKPNIEKLRFWCQSWLGMEDQNEWYFFSHKDKKYPIGTQTKRATTAGFWKATGRDKAIYLKHDLVGMRKTLVFYKVLHMRSNTVTIQSQTYVKHD
nr:NAC domain-containing protein 7-like [Tanacetum cinerariifolium]